MTSRIPKSVCSNVNDLEAAAATTAISDIRITVLHPPPSVLFYALELHLPRYMTIQVLCSFAGTPASAVVYVSVSYNHRLHPSACRTIPWLDGTAYAYPSPIFPFPFSSLSCPHSASGALIAVHSSAYACYLPISPPPLPSPPIPHPSAATSLLHHPQSPSTQREEACAIHGETESPFKLLAIHLRSVDLHCWESEQKGRTW